MARSAFSAFATFVVSHSAASAPEGYDATSWHKALPREARKTLRLHTPASASRCTQTHDGVDSYLRTELRVDSYFHQNLEFLDRGYDHDEFGDVDNELDGLTITEPMDEVQLFEFCTGYNVL